jgi:hypothetical protein
LTEAERASWRHSAPEAVYAAVQNEFRAARPAYDFITGNYWGKPVFGCECTWEELDGMYGKPRNRTEVRRSIWGVSLAAGITLYADWTTDYDLAHGKTTRYYGHGKGRADVKRMNDFLSRLPWWTMAPHRELTADPDDVCLAVIGKRYAVFSESGATITLNLVAGSYEGEWFNPVEAAIPSTAPIALFDWQGGSRKFPTPVNTNSDGVNDWVLHLWSAASADRAGLRVLAAPATGPLRVHPTHPRYFLWRGQPAILITAGEHYGAVLNRDFDYRRYLEELKSHRFNLTRIFSGAYREVPGSFHITGNTLAPAPGHFLCPWARSQTPGAADGGNKFDLTKWDENYFARLKDFIAQADERGVVVELVFFCTMYDDKVWEASPMNVRNNVNGIGRLGQYEVYSAKEEALLKAQRAVVQKLVAELNPFDNVYYEVCNEPYERGGLTKTWNDQIIQAVVETEAALPKKHLIAQGFPPSSAAVTDLNPHVSILNFHAAKPDTVRLNHPLNKVLAFDETGGADRSDRKYRTEGWDWIISGGGVYDHLDFSFTTDRADGSAVPLPAGTPGGGGPELRRQLQVLKAFIERFDFIRLAPSDPIIREHRIAGSPAGNPESAKATVRALAEAGQAYAIYVNGGTRAELVLEFPAGPYRAEWVNTKTGREEKAETFKHTGGNRTLVSPSYVEDIALRVTRQRSGQ